MKTTINILILFLLFPLLNWGCSGAPNQGDTTSRVYCYGIEINGVLCGYSESAKDYFEKNEKPLIHL